MSFFKKLYGPIFEVSSHEMVENMQPESLTNFPEYEEGENEEDNKISFKDEERTSEPKRIPKGSLPKVAREELHTYDPSISIPERVRKNIYESEKKSKHFSVPNLKTGEKLTKGDDQLMFSFVSKQNNCRQSNAPRQLSSEKSLKELKNFIKNAVKKRRKKFENLQSSKREYCRLNFDNWEESDLNEFFEDVGFEGFKGKISKEDVRANGGDSFNEQLFFHLCKQNSTIITYWHTIIYYIHKYDIYSLQFHVVLEKIILDTSITFEDLDSKRFVNLEHLASALSDKKKLIKTWLSPKAIPRTLRVLVVITETLFKNSQKFFRKVIAPIEDAVFKNEFGMFHSSVIAGSWYLQWLNNSLLIPKSIETRNAFIVFDPSLHFNIDKNMNFKEFRSIVADVIIKWNTSVFYSALTKKSKSDKNCQDFVLDICEALGLEFKIEGALKHFLTKLRKKGECKIQFEPPPSFISVFKLESRQEYEQFRKGEDRFVFTFETHYELDSFMNYCIKTDGKALKKFYSEYCLLKSFDRGFWLRFMKTSEGIYKGRKCPFGDPRKTGSIYVK